LPWLMDEHMPLISPSTIQNRLLRTLPRKALKELLLALQPVPLPVKQVLHQPGDHLDFAYFPVAGMVSIVLSLEDGGTIEVGTVGSEGMLPIALVLGDTVANSESMVQLEGSALRMPADILRQRLDTNEALRRHFGRYAHSFHQQVAQTAACNGAHSLEQRCARWLLLARHRIGSDELPLTQEFLSMMLAVRRAGVTEAAGGLQQAGLIRYRHGHITVLDPTGLEEISCECFGRIAAQEAQLNV
jgi:CRP-like cAMP-binding protein